MLEVPNIIRAYEEVTCKIKFHPVVMGKYTEILTIKVFNFWPIDIKVFAVCPAESCMNNMTRKHLFNVSSPKTLMMNHSNSSKNLKESRLMNTFTAGSTRNKNKQNNLFNNTAANFYLSGSGEENVPGQLQT